MDEPPEPGHPWPPFDDETLKAAGFTPKQLDEYHAAYDESPHDKVITITTETVRGQIGKA